MSQHVAPWLQGLDEDSEWGAPIVLPSAHCISSASHDAASIRSRIPIRSSFGGSITSSSHASTQKRRNPLATLSSNNTGSLCRPRDSLKLSQSRSFSGASDGSVVQYDTVQQRAKSTSPIKQETLEWKRRLVKGQVGYGDQTDLFGATGLENIFAQTRPAEVTPKHRGKFGWMPKSAAGCSIPSSPPLWPARADGSIASDEEQPIFCEDSLPAAVEEAVAINNDTQEQSSFCSNPYDVPLQEPHSDEGEQTAVDEQQEPSHERRLMDATQDKIEGNRTVSGQTDVDDFSPVYISKHTTMNGHVEYKALDSRIVKRFQNMTLDLKPEGQISPGLRVPAETKVADAEESAFTDGPESESLPAVPDLSLSENLPTGTPPVAALCDRVQLRRGGYSQNGSFKLRPLSPSQSIAAQSTTRDPNGLLSPSTSVNHKHPDTLSAVQDQSTPGHPAQSEPRSRSSGSPLKLFGPHDTFTSNRLWRRMSQLDPDLSAIRSEGVSELGEIQQQGNMNALGQRSVSGGSFGHGELDDHVFTAEITITSASDSDKAESDRSPGSDIPPPGSRMPLGFRLEDFPVLHDTFKLKRKLSKRSDVGSKDSTMNASVKHLQPTVEDAPESALLSARKNGTRPDSNSAISKRPPNSPFKAPTPKRRRTLHATELEREASEISRSYHVHLQEAIGDRKRRDSRRGEDQDIAPPAILSQRKMLRPRNPTPSRTPSRSRREQIEEEIRETAEQFAVEEPETMEAVMEQIEYSMASGSPPSIQQQANVVANEVAKFSLRVQKASGDHTERKRSVTTQDFFNEAVMVMRLIREKAGRQSGLGSVAESEQEVVGEALGADQSDQDLSSLRVSRPPSREGTSGWRPRTSEQTDPRVISHLRRFEERNDTDFIAESALQIEEDEQPAEVVDEHSNIRIRGPLRTRNNHGDDDPSRPSTQHSQQSSVASQSTQVSAASSTGRTLLSRKSDNVGTLAPESVAHLIGEQVGAMTYDKDKQQWVKAKSPAKLHYGSFLEPPSNITSDDDPFREISDLPVDENKEEEIRRISSARRMSAQPLQPPNTEEKPNVMQPHAESRLASQETVLARPPTGYSVQSRHTYSSSDPSRYTALASSQQRTIETRATSWGNEELERLAAQGLNKQQPLAYAAAQVALALGTREGSLNDKLIQSCTQTIHNHACAEVEQTVEGVEVTDVLAGLREDTTVQYEDDVEDIDSPKLRQQRQSQTLPAGATSRGAACQMSLRRKTLTSKFNDTDLTEQSELSFVAPLPGERMMSVSFSVSRPLSKGQARSQIANLQSSPSKLDPSYILSDLPDFTVHEEDHERPSEKALARRLAQHAAAEVDDRYSLAVKDLVKTLTDVKADEPYWEDLRQLDLHDRSLASIHGLDHFCESVQEIDVSDNKLQYLNGAPPTIRQLVARYNQLSSLTSWAHLMNLQYVDIAGNQLENLDALGCLIHLRELRADNNSITSLQGLMHLDGLLKLRLRGNKLCIVDFEQSQLQRLEDLDLSHNTITAVHNLDSLSRLKSVKLDGNPLTISLQLGNEMSNLKYVSMKECSLQHLDMRAVPHVRELLLDDNALSTITGLEALRSLDVLSMRRQSLPENVAITILQSAVHARTIRLSENNIPTLHLNKSLLSVQHLELASVGLQELPDDFGLLLPNLTTLNLNFNALKDLRGLLNIQKLERLTACGNRLERLRKTIATLSRLTTLTSIDLRDNHLTQSFYPPHTCRSQQPQTSVIRRQPAPAAEQDDEYDEQLEAMKHHVPPSCVESDRVHQSRLDDETKLRRRVYHLLLGNSCAMLEQVDGLAFDKTGAKVRDRTWERLLELGIVRKSGAVGMRGDAVEGKEGISP